MRIFRSIFLPSIIIVLLIGFWYSPDFKVISAGVSIFLFGMYFLENGFSAFTGGLLENILRKTTDKLWKSIGFGMVSTTIMQSSSLVSVIAISFISAGMISLAAGIGIIFGANLGTTTGAWLIAAFGLKVKIAAYAMPMLVIGLILTFQKSKSLKGVGYILAGLGFLFLGIHYMKEGFEAFKDQIDLAQFAIGGFKGLIIYTFIGLSATVIMQSSHATLVLIITALSLGHVTYDNALALAIGANVGTTITAIIGSLSSNYQGKRLAGAHLIFNVVTGFIAIVGIKFIIIAVDSVSAAVGIGAEDYTLKLAVFHTIFNLIGVLVMAPFVGKLVKFLEGFIKPIRKNVTEPYFLNDSVLDFPETMLTSIRKEVLHLNHNVSLLLINGLHMDGSALSHKINLRKELKSSKTAIEYNFRENYKNKVKPLLAEIIEFIGKGQRMIFEEQSEHLFDFRLACIKLSESVKAVDGLRANMAKYFKSDNKAIRKEYNLMRFHIISVLQELNKLNKNKEHKKAGLKRLKELKHEIKEYRKATNDRLDKLIRKGKIDSITATSILNDRAFTKDAVGDLLEVAKILFTTSESRLKEEEEMFLENETKKDKKAKKAKKR